jgi:hypothetical protein
MPPQLGARYGQGFIGFAIARVVATTLEVSHMIPPRTFGIVCIVFILIAWVILTRSLYKIRDGKN